MKIIHTSDWHLGISLHNASLLEEQKNFVDFLAMTVKEQNIDAVMIAGDIFDHSVSSAEAISLYNETVTKLCNEISSYADAMNCVLTAIKHNFKPGKRNILMCHCFVSGSVLSESDRAAMVGGTSVVPSEIFNGFDYVALGHLHKPQDRGYNIRYSGSPLKYSFSESEHKKSVTILNIGEEITFEELEIVPSKDVRVIRGTYDEIIALAEIDQKRDDYIKIEVSDKYAGMEAVELFRTYYNNLLNISGKISETEESSLTVEELYSLSPDDILKRFYNEVTGSDLVEEQLQLFMEAMEAVENEEYAQ